MLYCVLVSDHAYVSTQKTRDIPAVNSVHCAKQTTWVSALPINKKRAEDDEKEEEEEDKEAESESSER